MSLVSPSLSEPLVYSSVGSAVPNSFCCLERRKSSQNSSGRDWEAIKARSAAALAAYLYLHGAPGQKPGVFFCAACGGCHMWHEGNKRGLCREKKIDFATHVAGTTTDYFTTSFRFSSRVTSLDGTVTTVLSFV
jgi:hypothetical protein